MHSSAPLPPRRHAERLTEQRNAATRGIDSASIPEALALLHAEDRRACAAAEAAAPEVARAVEKVVAAFNAGGRLIYVGAGTSGRLGVLDAAEQHPTFGVPNGMVRGIIAGGADALVRSIEGAEDDEAAGARSIDDAEVSSRDAVMGIASGGRTPFVIAALARARALGAATIFLSCTPALTGEDNFADVSIHALAGPEAIAGSTRMKAGTATKLILNQISTLAMIQIGKVYENLMVDLRPTNAKLRDRAARILNEVAGVDRPAAERLLAYSGNDLKVALVMALARCAPEVARKTLQDHSGHVARAIRTLSNR